MTINIFIIVGPLGFESESTSTTTSFIPQEDSVPLLQQPQQQQQQIQRQPPIVPQTIPLRGVILGPSKNQELGIGIMN
jgi:hypothetical protein